MHNRKRLLILILLFSVNTLLAQVIKPEFRGVWIATISNIDWASTVSSDEQKVAFIKLLEMHHRNGINAIIMQIRPATDAFYASPYEPWSQWLTGTQGLAPEPLYDPLEFMIEETHKRGMEFHAWMNPYRAVFNTTTSSITEDHITRIHPEWFINYGDQRFFDPGNKEVQQYVIKIVRDVVKRYNVDAIHFDDYFYPYPIPQKEFPDYQSFKKYGNGLSRADWRRANTDSIICMAYHAIKEENNKCQFGISPFGVWRHKDRDAINGSATVAAPSNYDDLFADVLLWLKNGWLDYVAPQLYWEMGHKKVAYEVLVDWWSKHTYGKNCYIGIGLYRTGSNMAWRDKTQVPRQIEKLRATPNIQGMVFYSSKTFENNPYGISDTIRIKYFNVPAALPKIN
ncbi:MAG: family 10 glycosylhydrolase [Ferruginibacter sp.]